MKTWARTHGLIPSVFKTSWVRKKYLSENGSKRSGKSWRNTSIRSASVGIDGAVIVVAFVGRGVGVG
jgi:hypothetical protein